VMPPPPAARVRAQTMSPRRPSSKPAPFLGASSAGPAPRTPGGPLARSPTTLGRAREANRRLCRAAPSAVVQARRSIPPCRSSSRPSRPSGAAASSPVQTRPGSSVGPPPASSW
jgi:hypothetical protein